MAPKLYVMYASPPCRTVLMVAKAIGLELDVEEVEKEALRTPEMLEVGRKLPSSGAQSTPGNRRAANFRLRPGLVAMEARLGRRGRNNDNEC